MQQAENVREPNERKPYQAMVVEGGVPTDCCKYAVVSWNAGREVCRVWDEEDARLIEKLLCGYESVKDAPEDDDAFVRIDALRWRAFCSTQKFRLIGFAGFEVKDDRVVDVRQSAENGPSYAHFGMEAWSTVDFESLNEPADRRFRELLSAYVDHMVAHGGVREMARTVDDFLKAGLDVIGAKTLEGDTVAGVFFLKSGPKVWLEPASGGPEFEAPAGLETLMQVD